jgi:hypothetical protein
MIGARRASLLPARSLAMSDRQLGFRSAPGAQLLRLGLLGVFEVIMGLHEEKPRTLPVADRMRLLQAGLRLPPPQIDISHEPTPVGRMRALQRAIVAKCRNVRLAKRRNLGAQPRLLSVGYVAEFAQVLAPEDARCRPRWRADRATVPQAPSRCVQPVKKNRVRGWRIPPEVSQTCGHGSACRSPLPV